MKLCVSYSNCQGEGLVKFIRRRLEALGTLNEGWEFKHYNNYQIILKEQSAADLFADSAKADVWIYQPTPAIQYCELSTEQMIADIVPKSALKLSYGYGFNHGFYPLVLHGQWQTSKAVLELALSDPVELLPAYDAGSLNFDCSGRFIDCLAEQRRREETMDIKMADFILAEYRSEQLFICENHPASAYFAELARRFLLRIEPSWAESLPFDGPNDANLPGGLLVAPQVVQELDLCYDPEPGAVAFFRGKVEELAAWGAVQKALKEATS